MKWVWKTLGKSLLRDFSAPFKYDHPSERESMQCFPKLFDHGTHFFLQIISRVPRNLLCKMLLWVRRLLRVGSGQGVFAFMQLTQAAAGELVGRKDEV